MTVTFISTIVKGGNRLKVRQLRTPGPASRNVDLIFVYRDGETDITEDNFFYKMDYNLVSSGEFCGKTVWIENLMDWRDSNRSDVNATLMIIGRDTGDEEMDRVVATLRTLADHNAQADFLSQVTQYQGRDLYHSICHNYVWDTQFPRPYLNDDMYSWLAANLEALRLQTKNPEKFTSDLLWKSKLADLTNMTKSIHTLVLALSPDDARHAINQSREKRRVSFENTITLDSSSSSSSGVVSDTSRSSTTIATPRRPLSPTPGMSFPLSGRSRDPRLNTDPAKATAAANLQRDFDLLAMDKQIRVAQANLDKRTASSASQENFRFGQATAAMMSTKKRTEGRKIQEAARRVSDNGAKADAKPTTTGGQMPEEDDEVMVVGTEMADSNKIPAKKVVKEKTVGTKPKATSSNGPKRKTSTPRASPRGDTPRTRSVADTLDEIDKFLADASNAEQTAPKEPEDSFNSDIFKSDAETDDDVDDCLKLDVSNRSLDDIDTPDAPTFSPRPPTPPRQTTRKDGAGASAMVDDVNASDDHPYSNGTIDPEMLDSIKVCRYSVKHHVLTPFIENFCLDQIKRVVKDDFVKFMSDDVVTDSHDSGSTAPRDPLQSSSNDETANPDSDKKVSALSSPLFSFLSILLGSDNRLLEVQRMPKRMLEVLQNRREEGLGRTEDPYSNPNFILSFVFQTILCFYFDLLRDDNQLMIPAMKTPRCCYDNELLFSIINMIKCILFSICNKQLIDFKPLPSFLLYPFTFLSNNNQTLTWYSTLIKITFFNNNNKIWCLAVLLTNFVIWGLMCLIKSLCYSRLPTKTTAVPVKLVEDTFGDNTTADKDKLEEDKGNEETPTAADSDKTKSDDQIIISSSQQQSRSSKFHLMISDNQANSSQNKNKDKLKATSIYNLFIEMSLQNVFYSVK